MKTNLRSESPSDTAVTGARRPPGRTHLRLVRRARTAVKRLTGRECWHRVQVKRPREFHGTEYGGWWVCPDLLSETSVVYSFGVGEDVSFDLSIVRRFGLRVFAFDPTPRVIEWIARQRVPERFTFVPVGLAAADGTRRFFPPANPADVSHSILPRSDVQPTEIVVRRLSTILAEQGHTTLDLLKIDIEGAEYEVLDDLLASSLRPTQLLVEFHHGAAYGGLTLDDKRRAVGNLVAAGYRIVAISDIGMEYSFVHERT